MFNFDGKYVCIAGGAGYLGNAICRGFLEQGASLLVCDFNREKLGALASDLKSRYPSANIATRFLDVADYAGVTALFSELGKSGRKLDAVINATFHAVGKPFPEILPEEFNRSNEINITATYNFMKEALPYMADESSFILFSSMYGIIPPNYHDYPEGLVPNPIEYGAGKAAVIQMVKYVAAFCGKRGIRVNAIAPGPFPWAAGHAGNEEFIENLGRKSMLGRIGRQGEIAGAAVFLASEEASYITGQVLSVDGGITAW